jgi:hypothetical protein
LAAATLQQPAEVKLENIKRSAKRMTKLLVLGISWSLLDECNLAFSLSHHFSHRYQLLWRMIEAFEAGSQPPTIDNSPAASFA